MIERSDYHDRTRQTITLNLPDLINTALQAALNDGNGLDRIGPDSLVTLTVNVNGHSFEFDNSYHFDIQHDIDDGGIFATAEYDTVAEVILDIENPDRSAA